jgi:four helix bundle protein
MQDYRKLKVWEKSHQLALGVYGATRGFPRVEEFRLAAQLRRASVSIPANIAEGSGRGGKQEFRQFLVVAMGSANEVEYHLLLARDLGYLTSKSHRMLESQVAEVRRMLSGLVAKISSA